MDLHIYRNSQDRWHDVRAVAREREAVLAINALTVDELVRKLTPDIPAASNSQRFVLTQSAVVSAHANAIPGIVKYSLEALSDLKGARVRGSDLRAVGSGTLADVLDAYDDVCAGAGLVDPQERVWLAALRVAESPPPSVVSAGWFNSRTWLLRFKRVVLHALYDLNEAQFRLLQNLIEVLPDGGTVMLFNTTANVKPTQFAEWTWRRFIQDESLADKTFPEFCRPSTADRPVLDRLFVFESRPDSESGGKLPPDDSIRIFEASGRYREVEFIGSEIANLLGAGEGPEDVGVVVRHIEIYGEMIEDVFTRYGIPHVFETGIPLIRVPFIKYWLSLLDLVTSERSRYSLARVMGSAYYEPRLTPRIDCERELTAFGYIDRRHLKASALAARKASPLTAELAGLEQRLDDLESATRTVFEFLNDLQPGIDLTPRDREAWELLETELRSLDGLAGKMTFSDFRRIASEIAGSTAIDRWTGPVPPGISLVRIVTPASLGYRTWRWTFAPGMADGEFPARSFSNPLMPESVLDDMNRRIRPRRIWTSKDRSRREPLFLFNILESGSEGVTVTWPGRTLEGDTIYPSVYVGEIARHYEVSPIVQLDYDFTVHESRECLRKIADVWRRGGLDETHARHLLGAEIVERSMWESKGIIRGDIGAGALPMDPVWHPSELNSLAACPFTFFARYRLKLRTMIPPDFEVPASEVGILAHSILRDFYASPVPPSLDDALARMTTIVAKHLSNVDVNGQGPYSVFDPGLWQIRRRQLVSTLLKYVEFAVRDAIDGFETLPQYLDKSLPETRLGQALLGGKPDHVAVHRREGRINAIRVDDFKYSALSGSTSRQLKESVQIPVYAWLAMHALDAGPDVRIEGRYLLLRSPSSPVVSHCIDHEVFAAVRGRIESLLDKVARGSLHPDPADKQDCPECDYRRLCRINGG